LRGVTEPSANSNTLRPDSHHPPGLLGGLSARQREHERSNTRRQQERSGMEKVFGFIVLVVVVDVAEREKEKMK